MSDPTALLNTLRSLKKKKSLQQTNISYSRDQNAANTVGVGQIIE